MKPTVELMSQKLTLLRENFLTNKTRHYEWRIDTLNQLKNLILIHQQELEDAKELDLGVNGYTTHVTEICTSIMELNHTLRHLKSWMKKEQCETPLLFNLSKVYKIYQPLGPTLIISSWNYPIGTLIPPLISAIAAGNPCIVKPSEGSPNTSQVLQKIIDQMDHNFFGCFQGDKDTSVALNKLPFDHIIFTGGSITGTYVVKDAAPNLTKVTLELGGINHTIVDPTADIDYTAKSIANFKFLNCGQTCLATNHVFVPSSLSKQFIEKVKYYMKKYYGEKSKECKSYSKIVN